MRCVNCRTKLSPAQEFAYHVRELTANDPHPLERRAISRRCSYCRRPKRLTPRLVLLATLVGVGLIMSA